MLVLSRKKNESIDIPGIGSLMIVDIRGDKVRLGFNFEPEVKIYRREVWDAILAARNPQPTEGEPNEETADVSR